MVHYAGASYSSPDKIKSWSCDPHCKALPDFAPKTVISDQHQDLQGFIGYDNDSQTIIISFRGTVETSIQNWITDLSIAQTSPWPNFPTVKVHKGFYQAYLALKPQILAEISIMPEVALQITGHSLGAGLASICAFDLLVEENYRISSLYNFGSPRVGNYDWSIAFRKKIPNNWRITHAKDIVVHAPPQSSGFYHLIVEVWYKNSDYDGVYHICNGSGNSLSNIIHLIFYI